MTDTWLNDLKKSSYVAKQALPIIREALCDCGLSILQVEGKDEEICKILDTTCGIDYFILKSDKQMFGVAWRCQWVEPGREYNSFTIRKSRDSGTQTEYEKRKLAIENDSIYPQYVVQAFANINTNEIISLAITTTKDELAFLDNPVTYKEERHTRSDKIGQASFYVLYWVDIRLYGYYIIIYKKDIGII